MQISKIENFYSTRRFVLVLLLITFTLSLNAQNNLKESSINNLIYRQNFKAQRESSANRDLSSNGDCISIAPGETLVLANMSGPGIIDHIWMTISSLDPFHGRSMVLRIYWENNDKPSVETPVGDFFGVGHGAYVSFESAVVSTSSHGRAKNCYWKMPFLKNAKVTVTNESEKYGPAEIYYYIDWEKYDSLPENINYFHANYRQQFPARPGNYTVLETEGEGHYAGTVYSVQNMEMGWFGEGDDRFYVDGEKYPSLSGTGTEDYFGDAWGFRQFNRLYNGVPLWEGYLPGDRVTAYRWHIQDPIPFKKSLKVNMEHRGSVFDYSGKQVGHFTERADWISSVAIWYQSKPVPANDSIPEADKRIAPYQVLLVKDLINRANPENAVKKSDISVEFTPMKPDGSIEFDFNVEKSGTYQINAITAHSVLGARYQPYLDGRTLGPELDLFMSGSDPIWESFDLHNLTEGIHTLRFEGRGDSPGMRSLLPHVYHFGIYYLILLRLEDMEGYHDSFKKLTN